MINFTFENCLVRRYSSIANIRVYNINTHSIPRHCMSRKDNKFSSHQPTACDHPMCPRAILSQIGTA